MSERSFSLNLHAVQGRRIKLTEIDREYMVHLWQI